MAELNQAFNKMDTQLNNQLFCFYSRVPVMRERIKSLEKNEDNSNFEWKNGSQIEQIETLNIELPVSREIEWELFSDSNFKDKGKITFSEESKIDNRLLSIKLDPHVEGSNYFIDIKVLKTIKDCLTDEKDNQYERIRSFINLDKLKESSGFN